MRKIFLLMGLAFLATSSRLSGQTLFTYGKYSVDAKEFLRAFNKNNSPQTGKASAIRDYLDLYINSKLKIRDAYDRGFDTLPQVNSETGNLRKQIAENFMSEPGISAKLQKEAFNRSLKDLKAAHIFISFQPDPVAADKKKEELLQRLKKGEDFRELAKQFSDDTTTSRSGGELGYITVFTLPYDFETAIYSTPVGQYSSFVTSKSGYHIFKTLGERKAVGKMKAKQILLAIPPDADESGKKGIAARADSLYQAIKKGSDIGSLAARFSNDYISAASAGNMPDISVGQYDPTFESFIWSLSKDGELAKPFLSSHGWHIIQRVSVKPVITDSTHSINKQELMSRIMTDSRWKSSREFIYKKVLSSPGVKKLPYDDPALWAMADSLILLKPVQEREKLIPLTTPIFKLGDSVYRAVQFINYATYNRFLLNGQIKSYSQIMEEYTRAMMYNYYSEHLELYSEEFRNQMAEFKDGNMFFEIMQQEIWNKAQNDTAALKALYEKNKTSYTWQKSVNGIVFYFPDESLAKAVHQEIKKAPVSWRKLIEPYAEKVVADSSRFDWEQLPLTPGMVPQAGRLTDPVVNPNDQSASFAYILEVFTTPIQRSFAEARGMVINDYQVVLEKKWIDALRKKYPVVINQKTLEQISK